MPFADDSIEVFQDLYLSCPIGSVSDVPLVLQPHVRAPWHRAPETENRLAKVASPGAERCVIFERSESDGVPPSRLALYPDGNGYKVANVVPTEEGSLGERGYNNVLNDFVERVVKPAQREGLSAELTKRRQTITDWTSKEAANALHHFSTKANKSTGSLHPMDAKRWREFLIADHRAQGDLSSYTLRRWLIEVENWPMEEAGVLVGEWEDAVDLLKDYDHCH